MAAARFARASASRALRFWAADSEVLAGTALLAAEGREAATGSPGGEAALANSPHQISTVASEMAWTVNLRAWPANLFERIVNAAIASRMDRKLERMPALSFTRMTGNA